MKSTREHNVNCFQQSKDKQLHHISKSNETNAFLNTYHSYKPINQICQHSFLILESECTKINNCT